MPNYQFYIKNSTNYFVLCKAFAGQSIPFTPGYLCQRLMLNPNTPTALGLVQTLKHYGMDCMCTNINWQQAAQITEPFIAYMEEMGGNFVYVQKLKDGHVYYSDKYKGDMVKAAGLFAETFAGVVILFEKTEKSKEPFYTKNQLNHYAGKLLMPTLLLACLLLFYSMGKWGSGFLWLNFFMQLTSLLGIATSILLLLQSVKGGNDLLNKFCGIGQKSSCFHILATAEAKFLGWISWSDIGLFYFSFQLLLLFGLPYSAGQQQIFIFVMACCCLPYTFYSFYLQAYKLKIWCPLCILVLSILWVQFGIQARQFQGWHTLPDFETLGKILLFLILSLFITIAVSKYIYLSDYAAALRRYALKFAGDRSIFELKAKAALQLPEGLIKNGVTLGNRQAEKSVTIISNLTCGPCTLQHQEVAALLQYDNNLRVDYFFVSPDERTIGITRIIVNAYETMEQKVFETFFNDYFKTPNYERDNWAVLHKAMGNLTVKTQSMIDYHQFFANEIGVSKTPVTYYNGYLLNDLYRLEHLQWLN